MEHCPKEKWEEQESKVTEEMSKYEVSGSSFTWIKSTCPDCGTVNWIDMLVEVEVCECHKCQKTFWISKKIYEDYKINLVMQKVFDSVPLEEEEWIIKGQVKPD